MARGRVTIIVGPATGRNRAGGSAYDDEGSPADMAQDRALARRKGTSMAAVEGTREDQMADARRGGSVSAGGRGNMQAIAGKNTGAGKPGRRMPPIPSGGLSGTNGSTGFGGGGGGAGGLAMHGSMAGTKMAGYEPRHTSRHR